MILTIDNPIGHKRRPAIGIVIVIAALVFAKSAVAENVERPFSPPVGSHWAIESVETETDEGSNDPTTTSTKKSTQLLTYEAKLPDGFRITFQTTASTFEGDTDDPVMMRAGAAVMRGLTYRAVTDLSGKPLRVENLDEVRATLRKLADTVSGTLDDPRVAVAAKKVLVDMADKDDNQAAEHVGRLRIMALVRTPGSSRESRASGRSMKP